MQNGKTTSALTYPWYVVTLLMFAQTFSFVDRMILGLLVGPIRESFNISDTQFSLLAGFAFAVFYGIMGLPLARIADRSSRKLLIVVGISVWSVMTALCGTAQGYWSLFLARMGVGVGEASLSPAAYSMISDMFPKKVLARAFSLYTFGVAIGSGLAYIIGGRVVAYVSDLDRIVIPIFGEIEAWQLTFFIVGLPGLLLALVMLLTMKEPIRKGKIRESGSVPIREVLTFISIRKKAIIAHILGVSIFIMVVFSLNIWGPTYLIRTFGYSPPKAGLIMGMLLLVGAGAGLFAGGYLGDKWYANGKFDAYSRVILYSIFGTLPFTLALGFTSNPMIAIGCLGIATFFSAFQGGIAAGLLQLMAPNEMRGQVVALYFLTANLIGLGIGPTVIAACTDYVFQDDAAIGKSIALSSVILCPIAFLIILYSLKHVRAAVAKMQSVEQAAQV